MADPSDLTGLGFAWDPDKNDANIAKHGLGFGMATRAFDEPMLRRRDERHDYGEERWIALGRVEDVTVAIVYTMRGDTVRIISARKANRHEKEIYDHARRQTRR